MKFSKSRYALQKDCLGKYYWTYIKGFRDLTLWPGTLGGTAIHLYLERYYPQITSLKYLKDLPPFEELYREVYSKEIASSMIYKTPYKFNEKIFIDNYQKFINSIFKFLFNYLPTGKLVFEEAISKKISIADVELEITGVIDLQILTPEGTHIIDFKTTKNNASWVFVDFSNDPQSLSYYFLTTERNPLTFGYTIFNIEQKTIIVQATEYSSDGFVGFNDILKKFIEGHQAASDPLNWTPSKNKCKWCSHRPYCSQKI